MTSGSHFHARLTALVCAVLASSATAGAQQVDPTFNPGANGAIRAVAVQADKKIVVGGDFTMLGGGGTGTTPRSHIGRLNPDGSIDGTFDPGADHIVHALAIQPNGQILVSGQFLKLGGGGVGITFRPFLGRLNQDGSVDETFKTGPYPANTGSINTLAIQANGQILIGGAFTNLLDYYRADPNAVTPVPRLNIARLNANGSVDMSFNPGAAGGVFRLVVQTDDKILVGGQFTGLGGGTGATPRSNIGRLDPDGLVDTLFNPGANLAVFALAVQADGKILVGGSFRMLGGGGTGTTARFNIGRLYRDGSLDTGFDPGAYVGVSTVVEQADGEILVGGAFTQLGAGLTRRYRIGRLHPDGAVDPAFDPGANGAVSVILVQADGNLLVAGQFTALGGGTGTTPRYYIGRLLAPTAASTAPSGLTGSVTESFVTLSWLAPAAGGTPTAYLLEVGSASGRSDLAVTSTGSPATTLSQGGVPNGLYYLRVRAVTAAGTSGPSNELALRVGPAPPGVPTGLTGSVVESFVTLSWQAPAAGGAPTAYVIEAGSAPGLANLVPGVSTGTPATSIAQGGVPNGLYYVRVRASNAAGTSGPSNEIALQVGLAPPGAPTGLTAVATGSQVTLTWVAPTTGGTPREYLIDAGAQPGFPTSPNPLRTNSMVTTFTVFGVPDGTYYVRVRAWNVSGTSAPSNEATLVVGCTAAPGAPSNFIAHTLGYANRYQVDLDWSPPGGDPRNAPTTYLLEGGPTPGSAQYGVVDLVRTSPSYTAYDVPAGTYYLRVRARNACGTSPPSNEVLPVFP